MKTANTSETQCRNFLKTQDDCGCDEVTPEYAKKLERISREVDEGKGKKFENMRELKEYLAKL